MKALEDGMTEFIRASLMNESISNELNWFKMGGGLAQRVTRAFLSHTFSGAFQLFYGKLLQLSIAFKAGLVYNI